MKRFEFTLARILAFKQTMYDKERNTLAQMRAERLAVEIRKDDTKAQRRQRSDEFNEKAAQGISVDEVNEYNFLQESAARLIEVLELDLYRRDIEIEKQLVVVVELDKEVKSLEKLRERQWEEYQADAAREEQQRILEIVSGRFAEEQREAAASNA